MRLRLRQAPPGPRRNPVLEEWWNGRTGCPDSRGRFAVRAAATIARLAPSRDELRRWYAPDAPRPASRRQGPELPQAGPRLVVSRAVRGPRRHPGRARGHVPARARLPLPLLPGPHDLPRRRPLGRRDPAERDVQARRRRLRRPAHVEPLREARDPHPERLVLRVEPRPARHGPRPRRSARTASDAVVFCSVGESSTSEGYFYEAVNGASREKLPVVFVVQDNGYGIAVPKSDQTANALRVGQLLRAS